MTPRINDEEFYAAFPLLYGDHSKPMTQTAMCWGIGVGGGWHDILWMVSEQLEKHIRENYAGDEHRPRAVQVKEKFGGLRFYMSTYDDFIEERIRWAEVLCARTCERTGKPGRIRTDIGWARCLSTREYAIECYRRGTEPEFKEYNEYPRESDIASWRALVEEEKRDKANGDT